MSTFASVLAVIGTIALVVVAIALVALAVFAWHVSRQVIRAARAAATSVAAAHALVRRINPELLTAKLISGR